MVFDDEDEVQVLNEAALYDYFPSGKNAVERFFAQKKYEPGSDEHIVLNAMTNARVTLVELGAVVPSVGVKAKDLLFGRELLLADVGLSDSADEGMVLLVRLLEFDEFAMTTGVARLFHPELAEIFADSFAKTMSPRGGEELGARKRSRLGAVLYRWAVLDLEDAKMELASIAAAEMAEDDPRRVEFERMRARWEEAT
jgi:hypothetical protein